MKSLLFKGIRKPDEEYNTVIFSIDSGNQWANVPLYLDEVNHSPTGFEWGYNGSGPAQLGYALLRTYFRVVEGDNTQDQARTLYQRFKQAKVSGFGDTWELDSKTIKEWLEAERVKNGY